MPNSVPLEAALISDLRHIGGQLLAKIAETWPDDPFAVVSLSGEFDGDPYLYSVRVEITRKPKVVT